MAEHLIVALAGNPNAGKSTIFNALTGSRQHVGNWPGKTVEKKQGTARIGSRQVAVVDLPGAYSLTAYSVEEVITRDFILNERPDAVVAVVDATNLERNLYMVVQLIELGAPVVVALNMIDMAQARGICIDTRALSAALGGVPVVATAAHKGLGLDALRQAILATRPFAPNGTDAHPPLVDYGPDLEREIAALQARIAQYPARHRAYPPRWLAIKLLENETAILQQLEGPHHGALLAAAQDSIARLTAALDEDPETLIVDRRYAFIDRLCKRVVSRPPGETRTPSERIDAILTHRWAGLPIFLLLMWVVFQMVANVSAPLLDWVDGVVSGPVARWAVALLGALGLGSTWVESLLVEGIIAGVGGVLVFLPVLFFLYLAIALLEDTGYMARAAFVMDRFMHALGLHGKSFLPMLVGFGCTVPAIYATRTLENEDDRKLTAFLTTFMSCGARLPVYVIFGSAFFGAAAGNLVFAMYMIGILIAIGTGLLLKRTLFKDKPAPPFVLELPPYRLPTLRGVWLHIWERSTAFVRSVWTTITLAAITIWLLMAIPVGADLGQFNQVPPEQSLFGALSRGLAPVFAPAGFGRWEATGALVTGFVAKEVVISTMSQIYVGTVEAAETEPPLPLGEGLLQIAGGFGRALLLTGQEIVNIVPRTANLLPGLNVPEVSLGGGAAEEEASTTLENALRDTFTPLEAVAFNVFVLLYVPCMSAAAAMRHEFGPRWMLFQMGYTLVVAWLAAVVVHQAGHLLGIS